MEVKEIIIKGAFDDQMLTSFERAINAMTSPCMIGLDIESNGGAGYVLEAMCHIISEKKKEGYVFLTNVDKYAYSCGFLLFMLGDIMITNDNARFMYHDIGLEIKDRLTASDAKEIYEALLPQDEFFNKIVLENTNLTPAMFSLLKKNTTFFNKEDLINIGVMEKEYSLN